MIDSEKLKERLRIVSKPHETVEKLGYETGLLLVMIVKCATQMFRRSIPNDG
jgi:hypothetical protein